MWIEIGLHRWRSDKNAVTSLAEVWIEISNCQPRSNAVRVTSLAEVWIEITRRMIFMTENQSLPLRKCGLKYV